MKRVAFKAYDIRGRVPDELNEEVAYRIGRVFVELLSAQRVVVGQDVRLTSLPLASALIRGLRDGGCDVVDIGVCGTEMVYFSTSRYDCDGGIMVTASHNPMDYNGLKLVGRDARPISGDSGLRLIEDRVVDMRHQPATVRGERGAYEQRDVMADYVENLLTYIEHDKLRPYKVVVNAGNGCSGPVIDMLAARLPFQFIRINHQPDGKFPNGIPNPLLVENRAATSAAVREYGADFGVAWDGDFDRCFLFDGEGNFIEGYYMVGLLAEAFLRKNPGAKIIHDPRLTWNSIEIIEKAGGQAVQSKTGHAFIKERMRQEDAVYGGEMSAHHYFKSFAYCDSGMIPWLLVAETMSVFGQSLAALICDRMEKFPVSGEINSQVADVGAVLAKIEQQYITAETKTVDRTDGLSVEFARWRFNIRASNTEPLLRLNVESRGDRQLMEEKTRELLQVIRE